MTSIEFETGIIIRRNGVVKVYSLTEEEMFYAQPLINAMKRHNEQNTTCITAEIPHKATTIANLRKSKGYTQEYLAKCLGVSQSTVAGWETGRVIPAMKNIIALAELFGKTVDDICALLKK